MSTVTGIEWTDATWNPIRGCSRVSEGCRNCYAEKVAYRFSGHGQPYEGLVRVDVAGERKPEWSGQVRFVENHLLDPLRWKEPRRIFVNSMSDLFHSFVSLDVIDRIFSVMARVPKHTFQVLTKRPERMQAYMSDPRTNVRISQQAGMRLHEHRWPLPNVWLGVSVEDQKAADVRIPLLLQTPCAVRFISAEPLLGPVRLTGVHNDEYDLDYLTGELIETDLYSRRERLFYSERISWVIVGGESGPGARPMHPDWARSLRDQCVRARVPFFFKQWGDYLPAMCDGPVMNGEQVLNASNQPQRVGKKAAGAMLDDREWKQFPGDVQA